MTREEAREYADNASYEDCPVFYNGNWYWCYGLTGPDEKGRYSMMVDKCKSFYPEYEFIECVLDVESTDRGECMRHLLEDPIWDGKTFWEAYPDMKRY